MDASGNAIGMLLLFASTVAFVCKHSVQASVRRSIAFVAALVLFIFAVRKAEQAKDWTGFPVMQVLTTFLLILLLFCLVQSRRLLLRSILCVAVAGGVLSGHFVVLAHSPEYKPKINRYGKTAIPPGAGWEWYSGLTDVCPVTRSNKN